MKKTGLIAAVALVATGFFLLFSVVSSHASLQNSNSSSTAQPVAVSAIYNRRCASCHGKDGRAKTFKAKFNDARDLTNSQWQESVSDEQLYNSIMNGRGKMPPFGKKLTEDQVDALVNHVRSLKKQ